MSIEFTQNERVARQRGSTTQYELMPAVTVIDVTDPTAAGDGVEVLTRDLLQLEAKPFRGRQIILRLEDSMVLFQSTNLLVRTRTTLREGLLAFVVFGPLAEGTVNGLTIRPNLMLVAAAGLQVEFIQKAGYESLCILLPPGVLASHLTVRQRGRTEWSPDGIKILHADENHARRLFDWGKRLTGTAALHPEIFNGRKETRAAVQSELLEMLFTTLDTTTAPERTHGRQTRQARSRIVKLAEDYALAHACDRLYVTDLCVAAGVSERTLVYAFQEVMGLSPMAYLTRLRLHRVRQALRMAPPGSTTVSAQALTWGFWHFGDFSRAYKECFGELPSETLRRKPPDAGNS